MKKLTFLILIGFSIFSCSKSDDNVRDTDLVGSWNWKSTTGGIAGIHETPESTGDKRRLEISKDSIKGYLNDSLTYKSGYVIKIMKAYLANEPREMLISDNDFRQIVELNGDDLTLIEDNVDGFASSYKKD